MNRTEEHIYKAYLKWNSLSYMASMGCDFSNTTHFKQFVLNVRIKETNNAIYNGLKPIFLWIYHK